MRNDTRIFLTQAVGLKEDAQSWRRDLEELYNENPWLHGITNPDQREWFKLYVNPVVGYIKGFDRSDVSLINLEDRLING